MKQADSSTPQTGIYKQLKSRSDNESINIDHKLRHHTIIKIVANWIHITTRSDYQQLAAQSSMVDQSCTRCYHFYFARCTLRNARAYCQGGYHLPTRKLMTYENTLRQLLKTVNPTSKGATSPPPRVWN